MITIDCGVVMPGLDETIIWPARLPCNLKSSIRSAHSTINTRGWVSTRLMDSQSWRCVCVHIMLRHPCHRPSCIGLVYGGRHAHTLYFLVRVLPHIHDPESSPLACPSLSCPDFSLGPSPAQVPRSAASTSSSVPLRLLDHSPFRRGFSRPWLPRFVVPQPLSFSPSAKTPRLLAQRPLAVQAKRLLRQRRMDPRLVRQDL